MGTRTSSIEAKNHQITVITPVYEDSEAASILFKEIRRVLGDEVFVVAIDDGSVRQPLHPDCLSRAGLPGVVIQLRRNVGHQRAIAIGLCYAAEHHSQVPWTVIMDSDGEDLPETIVDLTQSGRSVEIDIVVARRKSRVETLRFKLFYGIYRLLFQVLSGRSISFGNFMALKPAALKRLAFMSEPWIHVAASVLLSKLRVAVIPLVRGPRYAGKSKMNFVGLALHGFKALMVFAEDVLVRVGMFCTGAVGLAIVGAVLATGLKLAGMATPGWYSMALGILAIVSLQAGALGLMSLMSLMLTGVVRGGAVAKIAYLDFVEAVLVAELKK